MKAKRSLIICLLIGILAATFVVLKTGGSGKADAPSVSAVPVGAAKAVKKDVAVYLRALGTVQAYNTVSIHPQADGQLVRVVFQEGQNIRAGDILAEVDSRSHQAAFDQALAKKLQNEAQLNNARLDLQRYSTLAQNNSIERQKLDMTRALVAQFEAAVKGDEAAIAAARVQLEYTSIRSPIDGQAGIRQLDVGNIVHGGGSPGGTPDTLVVITQVQPITVVFSIPQKELFLLPDSKNRTDLPVHIHSKEDGALIEKGRLTAIDNQIDPTTGTIKLKAIAANADGKLWPGEYVDAKLLAETRVNAITVPATAVQNGPKGPYVYVVAPSDTVEIRPVAIRAIDEDSVEIAQGLSAGEVVVTSGHYRLTAGVKVLISRGADKTEAPEKSS